MKKILITGAGGFFGRNLIDACLSEDIKIVAMSSQTDRLKELYQNTGIEFLSNEEAFVWEGWGHIDVLINCAFPRNVDGIQMALGLKFINDVLNKAVQENVGAVINISSQSVYSQTRLNPATEETKLNLENKYAVGKYASELMANNICKNVRHTNIRMASLIGAEFKERIINKFVEQAIQKNDLYVKGGKQRFGFLDVLDAANAILKVIMDDGFWNETYNLGIEKSYSLLQIAESVENVCRQYGIKVEVELEENDDWKNTELVCKEFYERFKWKPSRGLNESINRIIQSYNVS